MKTSDAPPSTLTNNVFISYSRKDQPFVKTLDTALRQAECDPWVDWDDIKKGEEWWDAIQRGIEGSDTFLFVLSPDSVASQVCRDEIEHAAKHNKRFLPIVRREGFDIKHVHPKISSHNWLFFRETDDFATAFQELKKAISIDLDYVRTHTRLLVRAIEWQKKGQAPSSLLRGSDLVEAEQWLINGTAKEPKPAELQAQYINSSREAKTAQFRARQKEKHVVVIATVLANVVLSIVWSVWFYQDKMNGALQTVQNNLINALHTAALGIRENDLVALSNLPSQDNAFQTNSLYQAHQKWLSDIRTVYPDAYIETYAPGPSGQLRWVGDVSRDLAGDQKGTRFLKSFDPKLWQRELLNGKRILIPSEPYDKDKAVALNGTETIVMTPYSDVKEALGRVISASQPIKNASGEIVGAVQVDFTEEYLMNEQKEAIKTLVLAYAILFVWQVVLSWFILRSMRPIEEI